MNWNHITAVAQKDLIEVRQNRSVWVPMVLVPLIFVIILPLALILIPTQMNISTQALTSDADLKIFMEKMPAAMSASLQGLDDFQKMLVLMLGYLFAPMFLIFPLMFSAVIAAESFAGERERKTMEALLYTPASDRELFLGKMLAAFAPSILISWGSFLLYIAVLNTAGYPIFHRLWFPLPTWYPLIFWITPALAVLGTSATVLISAKMKTFMGAYQTSSSLVVLVLGLLVGQITGVLYLTVGVTVAVGGIMWAAALGLTYIAVRSFSRKELLAG